MVKDRLTRFRDGRAERARRNNSEELAMDQPHGNGLLLLPLLLLAVAVISVPLARLLRLSPIVAYLAAGVVVGPFGLALVRERETIVAVSELGVVLLLFLIGVELEFSRLLALRRAIFGLGAAQLALTATVLGGLAFALGLTGWRGAVIGGLALAMSATAIALKILEERGQLQQPYGQRAFGILLFQDMSVVPILALLPLLAPGADTRVTDFTETLIAVGRIGSCIAAVVIARRYLLNPFLALLAGTGAREVMTSSALLVVLGAAALMQVGGMSMALGAFLAGGLPRRRDTGPLQRQAPARAGQFRRRQRGGAHHRLRPLRPTGDAMPARRSRRYRHHRQ